MSKLILSLDGGGVRGAATTEFLTRVEKELKRHGKNLRDEVDFFAGTSAGGTIALALATTNKSMEEIDELHGGHTAQTLFSKSSRWPFIPGILRPKYSRAGKLEVLNQILGDARLGDVAPGKEALVVTYGIHNRKPLVIKSTKAAHRSIQCVQVVDATSAAPTYFPTAELDINDQHAWLIDGGVIANNPTMCAITEAKKQFQIPIDDLRVLSVGTGYLTEPLNGNASQKWGALQWALKGKILDILSDQRIAAYQALTLCKPGNYIRVNSELVKQPGLANPPVQAMDCVTPENIKRIRDLGKFWFDQYGEQTVQLILNQYQGPSLDYIDPDSGQPICE
ncbi:patatin-like phospholipase family protein [Bacterioplanoides sp.]|uniref:patatin-like phospholipase family protein n=1 Tax=Bacterioplanoides sp. TaxID=2066072 RepID=UPI003B5B91EA